MFDVFSMNFIFLEVSNIFIFRKYVQVNIHHLVFGKRNNYYR